jgi:type I restriction enzyme M protein
MLTSQTKQRINICRDILVGKLPDPKSQVLQITNALIYKFMDDQDRLAEQLGGKSSFFINGLKPYAWHKLFDSKLTNQDRADKYIEGVQKLAQATHLPELFREIFKEAFVPFRDARVITLFISEINKFDYTHSEELGNAYEYLLSIMDSQGDAGQFRTPRHIIEFLVDVVDPQKGETIYDPAAGTAGFLIAAYNHILEANERLSAREKRTLANNIAGVDISPDMAKMARVNLYLHGFTTPNIAEGDTLTDEQLWGKKYDVIMANPPFMSPKGGIQPHDKFSIKAKRSEILFVDYIAEHLKLKGRAGVVVPEGVIFQGGKAYKELRKMLVEDGYLHTVISLPAGLFQPYSGVKTSLLILDRERAKEADEILFIKVEKDGYTLSTQRTKLCNDNGEAPEWCPKHSDLSLALEIAKAWQEDKKREAPIASWVTKQQIAESGDYKLTADRYRIFAPSRSEWPLVALGELGEVYQPKTITSKEISDSGPYKVYGANGVIGRYSEYNHEEPEVAVTCRGATCGRVNFTEAKSWITGNAMVVTPKSDAIDKRYLFHILNGSELTSVISGAAQPQITGTALKPFKIPLPPIDVQKQIVDELDRYQKIIDGARQLIDHYRPKVPLSADWPMEPLGKHFTTISGGTPSKADSNFWSGTIPWVSPKDMKSWIIEDTENHISEGGLEQSATKLIDAGTVVCVVRSGVLKHSFPVAVITRPMCINQDLVAFIPKSGEVISKFLLYTLISQSHQILENGIKSGVTVQSFHNGFLKNYLIPTPDIETQEAVVSEIEAEQALVDANRELVERFEAKIQATIGRVWGSDVPQEDNSDDAEDGVADKAVA